MKNPVSSLLIVLIGCHATPANAIVNVENMRVGPAELGISGNLDISISAVGWVERSVTHQ